MNLRERQLDESLEARARAALRRAIVPPPTPEYLRYRIDAMSAATVPARRGPWWPETPFVRWGRRNATAVRAVAAFVAVAALIGGGLAVWNARQNRTVAAPTFAGPVFDYGAVMMPQLEPGGAGFTYVDGKGLFVTGDYGATWSDARQVPAGDSARDHLWDVDTIDFVDAERGWMTQVNNRPDGSDVIAYRTLDGGRSWLATPVASFTEPTTEDAFVDAIEHFRDSAHGELLVGRTGTSGCQRWSTSDGGATWTSGGSTLQCIGLSPLVNWVTATLGYATSSPEPATDVIWTTQDGGVTWVRGRLGGTWTQPEVRLLVQGSSGLTAVVADTGANVTLPAAVMRSADGGATWTRLHDLVTPRGNLTPFDALSASSPSRWAGVFTSDCPTTASCPWSLPIDELAESWDEGRTWTRLGSTLYDPQNLVWWDDAHGFVMVLASQTGGSAVGSASETTVRQSSAILVTSDGGRTWRAVSF
jgi:photosystem II stability/assembly factor-like uncharacterized protein